MFATSRAFCCDDNDSAMRCLSIYAMPNARKPELCLPVSISVPYSRTVRTGARLCSRTLIPIRRWYLLSRKMSATTNVHSALGSRVALSIASGRSRVAGVTGVGPARRAPPPAARVPERRAFSLDRASRRQCTHRCRSAAQALCGSGRPPAYCRASHGHVPTDAYHGRRRQRYMVHRISNGSI